MPRTYNNPKPKIKDSSLYNNLFFNKRDNSIKKAKKNKISIYINLEI